MARYPSYEIGVSLARLVVEGVRERRHLPLVEERYTRATLVVGHQHGRDAEHHHQGRAPSKVRSARAGTVRSLARSLSCIRSRNCARSMPRLAMRFDSIADCRMMTVAIQRQPHLPLGHHGQHQPDPRR